MAGVFQIKGKENILQAYDNANVEVWAIFVGRNLITKGQGIDELGAFLDLVTNNGSNGVYTLKTYEDLQTAKQVKEKTEASGSLNFILNPNDFADGKGFVTVGNTDNRLYHEIQELKKEIAELKADPEPQTLEQAAIGLLNSPGELAVLISAVKELFTGNKQNTSYRPQQIPAAVGSLLTPEIMSTETLMNQVSEKDLERLSKALDVLGNKDKKIIEHLEKLAHIATNNNAQFQLLLMTLDGMK